MILRKDSECLALQDTMIWCILYHMMRDPDYWTDPDTFNPERFLGEDGQILKEERFVPYGIGIS